MTVHSQKVRKDCLSSSIIPASINCGVSLDPAFDLNKSISVTRTSGDAQYGPWAQRAEQNVFREQSINPWIKKWRHYKEIIIIFSLIIVNCMNSEKSLRILGCVLMRRGWWQRTRTTLNFFVLPKYRLVPLSFSSSSSSASSF